MVTALKIAIRVDASNQIGTGHLMRCLTLANGFSKQGAKVRFISRHMPNDLVTLIKSYAFEFCSLSDVTGSASLDELTHAHWLGVSQSRDATDTTDVLAGESWDWLVVDHYALDYRWEKILHRSVNKIMVIDDIADRNHDCDILLDQNYYIDMESRYRDRVSIGCKLLLGPKYALLRDEFINARKNELPKNDAIKRILVFFGGIDSDNYTTKAIQVLAELTEQQFEVDVVIGYNHPNKDDIIDSCKLNGYQCHIQTNKMAELMMNADLSIGAGGTAIWEKFILGLPSIVVATAENQFKQLGDLASNGYCYMLSKDDDLNSSLKTTIQALSQNKNLITFFANNCSTLVDGLGTQRVANELLADLLMQVRLVTIDDEKNIYEWRNHPEIRAFSRNTDVIAWHEHQLWFKKMLNNPSVIMLVTEIADRPVGVVRFDIEDNQAEVSIYLIQQYENKGLGVHVLKKAEEWMMSNMTESKIQFNACVLGSNAPSHQLFKKSGYQVETTYYKKITH